MKNNQSSCDMMNLISVLQLKKISTLLLRNNDEAAIITNEKNIGYLCGFYHSEGVMLITKDEAYLLVDFRYFEAAEKFAVGCKVIQFNRLFETISELLKKHSIKNVYFEASDLSISVFEKYKKAMNEINIDCIINSKLDDIISELRIIKGNDEKAKILKAQQIAESAYIEVLNYLKPGVTERSIAVELEYLMKKKGAERVSFDLITITGKKTSLPHGVPSDDIVCEGDFFTMDFGAVYEGYHSDTTRTVAVKSANEEMQKIYNIVLNAQLTALDKIKSGVKCSEIDKTARDIIKSKGYGEFFGHSTGHGVGLDIHELPYVSARSETVLQAGMVITDEPGIYLPNKFGVRIEDMVYVTKDGCENFVTLPKELIIV
ncbi:MAG: aminopeptidase P family protein [Ruminococcus sp.]|nr:aminopeptidase P family protein [Ruminococcus sp.]